MRRENGHGAIALDGPALTAAVCAVRAAATGGHLLVAVISAPDEKHELEAAIWSLRRQSEPPALIVVVCEACTDATRGLAEATGAVVFGAVAKTDTKAGALNQALDALLPVLDGHHVVLVLDADSVLAPTFVAAARRRLGDNGGVFAGRSPGGFLGTLRRNAYARSVLDVARRNGRNHVRAGTATLFSVETLRHVVGSNSLGVPPGETAPDSALFQLGY
jgi:cellulose synthase/poly-beta-1,6-N-acetylglucosamine synthase-like glycosyltransferase